MNETAFTKLHGIGNDFVVVDNLDSRSRFSEERVREICDRHFGIGADGLILAEASQLADVKMVFFNSDGSLAQMCGNGIRCLGKFLRDKALITSRRIRVETGAGIKVVTIHDEAGADGFFATVEMGRPAFQCSAIAVAHEDEEMINERIEVLPGEGGAVTCVSMGNPHAVFFVDSVAEAPVQRWGAAMQSSPLFPEHTNVEFVQVIDEKTIQLRVFERGVGETLACGTGACAAAVAAAKLDLTGRQVDVLLPGGKLSVEWSTSGVVYMTGPATTVFEGSIII